MAPGLSSSRPDKLNLVVFSGDFDKVHYALVLASGAAAIGTPVTLFFTMDASRALLADTSWRDLPAPAPYNTGGAMDDHFKRQGVADFEGLLEACVDLKCHFMACEMGLEAMAIQRESLRADVPIQAGGVVTFLNDASKNGMSMFI